MTKKKSGKKKPNAVYLAPPSNKKEANLSVDYDPETQLVDEFEQDLDFLLADTPVTVELTEQFENFAVSERPNSTQNRDPKADKKNRVPVVTKRIKNEILNFDIDFSDDDSDEVVLPKQQVTPLPKQRTTSPPNTTNSVLKPNLKPKIPKAKSNGKKSEKDHFKSSNEYFKAQMGISDSGDEDEEESLDRTNVKFEFDFDVSDEGEQIQLEEEFGPGPGKLLDTHNRQAKRANGKKKQNKPKLTNNSRSELQKPGQQKAKKPIEPSGQKPKIERDDGKIVSTRSALSDNRMARKQLEQKPKAYINVGESHAENTTQKNEGEIPKRAKKSRRRAPTAKKELESSV